MEVCRDYCLQVWTEALNLARVDASLELRKTENIFYHLALQIAAQLSTEEAVAPTSLPIFQPTNAATASSELAKEAKVEYSNPSPTTNT